MRYLFPFIEKDLKSKMVLLGGPRQCGKTTLAQHVLDRQNGRYFNWDADEDRKALLQKKWKETDELLVFDELHKYLRWKNWLKGTYDTQKSKHRFLITGSARLDTYRKGGDSLFGRYHYWRLHPFTLCERPAGISAQVAFQRLLEIGGFPEPFLKNDLVEARRWRRARYDQVVKQDLRDLETVRDISRLELFVELLRSRVGSPIVLSNLANDLEIAPKTAKHWLELLEKLYVIFVVRPHSRNLGRAVIKPPKVYFFDTGDVNGDIGSKFENLVACHLLKQLHFLEDRFGYKCELRYLRDKEKREVDFVVLKESKIERLIETKWKDTEISSPLKYYTERLRPKSSILLIGKGGSSFDRGSISVRPAVEYLANFRYE